MTPLEDKKTALFHAIGKSLTSWQFVENSLAGVFAIVSTCQSERVSRAIFFSSRDFSEKLSMTHNAMRLMILDKGLDKPTEAKWLLLRKKMIAESGFRNALAHFSLATQYFGNTAGEGIPILCPSLHDPNESYRYIDRRRKKMDTLDTSNIINIGKRFDALALDIGGFITHLSSAVPRNLQPQGQTLT